MIAIPRHIPITAPPAAARRAIRSLSPRTTWASAEPLPLRPVLAIAILFSLAWFGWYFHHGLILQYEDSISHPQIARRVLDSPTPGISQLGGVWPPLPHLLMLPLIWNDWLFFSGVVGAAVSMICYVLTAALTTRITALLGIGRAGSVVALAIMVLNPNMRYMQSTGMTELPLIATTVATVYFLLRWSQTESLRAFVGMDVALLAATATRYEGWVLWGAVLAALGFIMIRRHWTRTKMLDYVMYYLVFSSLFIAAWMAWNKIILGTGWLGFLNSEYASAEIWVGSADRAVGHIDLAFRTYWYAMQMMCGSWALLASIAGLGLFLVRDRLRIETVGILTLLFPVPFFTYALYSGQRPMHVPQINGDYYNVRFALQILPIVAFMVGILVDEIVKALDQHVPFIRATFRGALHIPVRTIGLGTLAATIAVFISIANIALLEPTLGAAQDNSRARYEALGACVQEVAGTHPRMLMENHANELVLFYSGIDMGGIVYEGSYLIWDKALANPDAYVDWIYMRKTTGSEDKVWKALHDNATVLAPYRIVFENDDVILYGRTSLIGEGARSTCTLPSTTTPTPAA
ncbi:MAG: hypothetical protein QM589_18445 [Thermomicrobiales bacterium]